MTTAADYIRAIKQARDAGDTEAVDYFRAKAVEAQQAEDRAAYDPTKGMGTASRLLAGVGQGMSNVARHAGNLVGRVSDEDLAEAKQLDAALLSTGAGKAGAFLGEVAATAPVGGLAGSAVKAGAARMGLPKAAQWLATAGGAGASQGAAEGALMADPGERLAGAGIGAAAGFALPVVGGKAWQALVRGVNPTRAARELLRRGVDLTPGQMNPAGSMNMLEEASQSVPVIGPMVKGARDASREGWQRAAREVGVPPNVQGAARAQVAERGLDDMYSKFGEAYDVAKGIPTYPYQMNASSPNVHLADTVAGGPGSFTRAAANPSTLAKDDVRQAADAWLRNALSQVKVRRSGPLAGTVDSDVLLSLRSQIRQQIREASQGASPDMQTANIMREAEKRVTEVLESQATPDVLTKLQATDRAYSQYKILEDAARRAGDQPGGMTPAQLSAAVRASTPSGPYARGAGGELRTLARAGREVLDQRSPPTGARLAALLPAAAAGYAMPLLGVPATLLGVTKTGRKILAGNTATQDKARALARALRRKGIRGKGIGTLGGAATGERAAREYRDDEMNYGE